MKVYSETHRRGLFSIEYPLTVDMKEDCDLGIQIAEDGRVWICIEGQALIRFRPTKVRKGGKRNDCY